MRLVVCVVLLGVGGLGCSSGEGGDPGFDPTSDDPSSLDGDQNNGSRIAEVVNDLGHLELAPENTTEEAPIIDGSCTYTERSVTEHYKDLLAFDPTGANVFLG